MPADLDLVRRLVNAEHGLAIVSTTRADGSVQTSLVNAGVLADPLTGEPAVGFVAQGAALKVRLIRAAGRAAVTFRSGWEWVGVEGPVTLIGPDDLPSGVDADTVPGLLRDVFTAAGGSHDDWDEFDRVMAAERRLAVLVHPARITSNG
jgi:PPOX class probable F420-dependent enzyme